MKLRRVACLFVCYAIFLSMLLSGCTFEDPGVNNEHQVVRNEELVETDKYYTLDSGREERTVKGWKYEPMATVTAFRIKGTQIKLPEGQDIEHNVWADAYREYLGIDLKHVFVVPSSDIYDTKVNQALAVDNLPDVMPIYTTLFYKMSDAGRLCNLKSYYDKYASEDIKYWMEKVNGGIAYKTCYRNNELGGLAQPSTQGGSTLWIRKDWLRNVDKEWPTNFNETLDVMRAFRNDDPNKNGKKDTYGMMLNSGLGGLSAISAPLGALNGWVDVNGGEDLAYGYTMPEWKEVCRVANGLYNEGVIDPEFIQKNNDMINSDYAGQVLGLTSEATPDGQINRAVEADPNCDWGWDYIRDEEGNIAISSAGTTTASFTCASKKSNYPEAAILLTNIWEPLIMGPEQKYHDFVAEDGVRYDSFFYPAFGFGGPEDYGYRCWEKVSSALIAEKNGDTAKRDEIMSTMNGEQKGYYERSYPWYIDNDPSGWRMCGIYGPGGVMEKNKEALELEPYYADRHWGAECDAWIKYGPNLHSKHIEYFSKMIIGETKIDEGFDKWVTYFKTAGGQECTDQYNEWWDAEGRDGMEQFGGVGVGQTIEDYQAQMNQG